MKRKPTFSLFLLLLSLLTAGLSGCSRLAEPVSATGFYFDTVISLTLYEGEALSPKRANALLDECFALCEHYEALFDRNRKDSDIWNINHGSGRPVTVSRETAALLEEALGYCEMTDGRLDITIAPISSLWQFSGHEESGANPIPSEESLNALLPLVDYRAVRVEGNTVTIPRGAAIDLGCIAKGYIADRLKEFLAQERVDSALINLGGNVLCLGQKPDHTPFRIGVRRPFGAETDTAATIQVADASLVSSGVYERYFEANHRRYHHLLDSATGLPVENGLLSVTIFSPSSAQGDALSTACFFLGLEEGLACVESLPEVEALFITEDYQLHPTSGMKDIMEVSENTK